MDTEYYYGTEGNDYYDYQNENDLVAYGYGGDDSIFGSIGNDYIDGSYGNDFLVGYDGNDSLLGYDGNDLLAGEAGDDYLLGGYGADTFAFYSPYDGVDVIADFYWEESDKIQISQEGFGTGSTSDFFYDNFNGNLLFQGILFAQIENVPTGFSPESDIVLV